MYRAMDRASTTDGVKTVLAGGAAGLFAAMVVCPLDVVKIRMQSQSHTTSSLDSADRVYYTGLRSALREIWRVEGLKGLYRGLFPTIFSYLPNWGIYFLAYDGIKRLGYTYIGWKYTDPRLHVLASACAGVVGTTVTAPCWIIRTRIMTQPHKPSPHSPYYYTGMIDAAKTIYRTEGVRSFYRGLLPSLLGVSHVIIQFPLYERLKLIGVKYCNTGDRNGEGRAHVNGPVVMAASSFSKLIASLITYPHEVLRTRLQTQTAAPRSDLGRLDKLSVTYTGVASAAASIAKHDGLLGFYRGFGTNLIRTVPASAITLLSYEWLKDELEIGVHEPRF